MTAPGTGWLPIESAPTTGPVVEVEGWNGREVRLVHYAYGDGDGLIPPFGPAWYYRTGDSSFLEMVPQPTHWRPVAASEVAK